MTKRVVTRLFWAIFIAVMFGAFVVPELYAYWHGEPTLSQAVWSWTGDYWPVGLGAGAYAAGLLCGHWWFPRQK